MNATYEGHDRRGAFRVPARGIAVLHAEAGPVHARIENLSRTGALLDAASPPRGAGDPAAPVDLELRLAEGAGWVSARTVRIGTTGRRWQVALAFARVDPIVQAAIDATIAAALSAARRRPVLVIDDRAERRAGLIARLLDRGMTPLAPRTPLEAIDLLARAQLHVDLCLLAPGFGVPTTDLAALLSDSFPWVTTREITDDLDGTAAGAIEAWATTPVARIAMPI